MARLPRIRRVGLNCLFLIVFLSFINLFLRTIFYKAGSQLSAERRAQELRELLDSESRKFSLPNREVKYMKNLFSDSPSRENTKSFTYGVIAITYLSSGIDVYEVGASYTFTFSTMLFSSWKYILNFYDWTTNPNTGIKVDILVFYDNKLDARKLPSECTELKSASELSFTESSKCYKRKVTSTAYSYNYINQFAFLQDPELVQIVTRYNYTLRTDPDCFLTPEFFNWRVPKSTGIIFNEWCYSTDFNQFMLRKLSEELGWKRQNITSVGSTWLIRSDYFVPLMAKTIFATMYVYENGWNTTRYPIVQHWTRKHPLGVWPDWWRPVSLLYGGDLAVHDFFDNLDDMVNQPYNAVDADAHDIGRIYDVNHIHAILGDGKFDKLHFFQQMKNFCRDGKPTAEIMREFLNSSISESEPMNGDTRIQDYAYAIALKGAVDYILKNGCFVTLNKPW